MKILYVGSWAAAMLFFGGVFFGQAGAICGFFVGLIGGAVIVNKEGRADG